MQVCHIVVPAVNETTNEATTAALPVAAPAAAPRPRSVPLPGAPAAAERRTAPTATPKPAAPGGAPLPAHATRLPPPMNLRSTVRQGAATGQAELRWHPAGDRYRLILERSSQAALGSDSQGRLGAAGLAPERHVESRRGRERRAVNVRREARRITFSGPQLQYPLLPAAQDRLSRALQLPAVLAAEPSQREPGSEVPIFVAGTRGDVQVWALEQRGAR